MTVSKEKEFFNELLIEITSNRLMLIYNCKGILDCNEEEIVLYGQSKEIRIIGSNLVLRLLTTNTATIEGVFMAIEWAEGKTYD